MTRRPTESWLWSLVKVLGNREDEVLPDTALRSYRNGELSVPERERVEQVLIRSSAHRKRLIRLAGDAVGQPPARIWERLHTGEPGGSATRKRRTLRSYLAVAAIAAGLLVPLALWVGRDDGQARFDQLADAAFDVRIEGTSEVRSESTEGVAHPDSAVRIWIEPTTPALDGLRFGLYRVDGARLELVPEDRYLRFERSRGAAMIQVPAASIVARDPGDHVLYVVITPGDGLPEVVTPTTDHVRAELAETLGGKVYPVRLRIRSDPDPQRDPPSAGDAR